MMQKTNKKNVFTQPQDQYDDEDQVKRSSQDQ